MCDTFVVLKEKSKTGFPIFSKNSDRDSNESQIFTFISNKMENKGKIKTTYIEIPQYEKLYSILLSKPTWLWGGEMGVNEVGVTIGNEAVFTKIKYNKIGLTGMDLIRIALETTNNAYEASKKIVELIKKFGQGGNCGYEKRIYYHNSFLITDKNSAYVLETVDKYYALKKVEKFYNISNKLSIEEDYEEISPEIKGKINFSKYFSNALYTKFSGAIDREKRGKILLESLEKHSLDSFIKILSDRGSGKFASMKNINMIGGGGLISSQTTSSMIVEYGEKNIVWFTMSPNPEISLFKPAFFTDESNVLSIENEEKLKKIWKLNNLLFRTFILNFNENIEIILNLRNIYQYKIYNLFKREDVKNFTNEELNKITEKSLEIEETYREEALKLIKNKSKHKKFYFTYYWQKENNKLYKNEIDNDLKNLYKNYLLF